MARAIDVANYLLTLSEPNVGELISNLKLQKLLYYCQGFNLAVNGEPLFDESIVAWDHGPVVPSVYQAFRDCGASAIPVPENFDISVLTESERELINDVYEVYGQFSAWKLRNLTHEEPPWQRTQTSREIPREVMRQYFSTQIEN